MNLGAIGSIPYQKTVDKSLPNICVLRKFDSNYGWFFEFFFGYNLNEKVSMNSGLNLSRSIIKYYDTIGYIISKGNLINASIIIPLLVKFKFSKRLPFYLGLGSYFGIPLSIRQKGTYFIDTSKLNPFDPGDSLLKTIEPTTNYNSDVKQSYKSIDFGLLLEIDYKIKLRKKLSLLLFSRTNFGLLNTYQKESNFKWKNYNILLGVGLSK